MKAGIQDGTLFVGFGSLQLEVPNPELFRPVIELLSFFQETHSIEEARQHFESAAVPETFWPVFTTITEGAFLMNASLVLSERFSRHWWQYAMSGAEPEEVQRRLSEAHVTILGCGGIGSYVAVMLATAGVGRLLLIDNDRVELSNLTRQHFFREADIGRHKANVLQEIVNARNPDVEIVLRKTALQSEDEIETLRGTKLIVLSADSPGLLWKVNRGCVQAGISFLNISYVEDIAVWGPIVVPGKTACWACASVVATSRTQDVNLERMLREINQSYRPPSFGPINALAASLGSLDIIKFLGGYGTPATIEKRVGLWTHELRLETQSFARNPNCSVCGESL